MSSPMLIRISPQGEVRSQSLRGGDHIPPEPPVNALEREHAQLYKGGASLAEVDRFLQKYQGELSPGQARQIRANWLDRAIGSASGLEAMAPLAQAVAHWRQRGDLAEPDAKKFVDRFRTEVREAVRSHRARLEADPSPRNANTTAAQVNRLVDRWEGLGVLTAAHANDIAAHLNPALQAAYQTRSEAAPAPRAATPAADPSGHTDESLHFQRLLGDQGSVKKLDAFLDKYQVDEAGARAYRGQWISSYVRKLDYRQASWPQFEAAADLVAQWRDRGKISTDLAASLYPALNQARRDRFTDYRNDLDSGARPADTIQAEARQLLDHWQAQGTLPPETRQRLEQMIAVPARQAPATAAPAPAPAAAAAPVPAPPPSATPARPALPPVVKTLMRDHAMRAAFDLPRAPAIRNELGQALDRLVERGELAGRIKSQLLQEFDAIVQENEAPAAAASTPREEEGAAAAPARTTRRAAADDGPDRCYARRPDTRFPINALYHTVATSKGGNENMDNDTLRADGPHTGHQHLNPAQLQNLITNHWDLSKPRPEAIFFDEGTNEPSEWPYPMDAYTRPAYDCVDQFYAHPDEWLAVDIERLAYNGKSGHTVQIASVQPATQEQLQSFLQAGKGEAEEDPLLNMACRSTAGCFDQASVEQSLKQALATAKSVQDTPGKRREVDGPLQTYGYESRMRALFARDDITLFVRSRQPTPYGVPQWAQRAVIAKQAGGSDQQCLPTPVTGNGTIANGPARGQAITPDQAYYCPDRNEYATEQPPN